MTAIVLYLILDVVINRKLSLAFGLQVLRVNNPISGATRQTPLMFALVLLQISFSCPGIWSPGMGTNLGVGMCEFIYSPERRNVSPPHLADEETARCTS